MNSPIDEGEIGIPLKNCPFCGYKAEMFYAGTSYYVVRCSNRECLAEQNPYKTTDEAAIRWNMRVGMIEEAMKE